MITKVWTQPVIRDGAGVVWTRLLAGDPMFGLPDVWQATSVVPGPMVATLEHLADVRGPISWSEVQS